jgi:hypothetical protein
MVFRWTLGWNHLCANLEGQKHNFRPQFFFNDLLLYSTNMGPDFRGIVDARSALTDKKNT